MYTLKRLILTMLFLMMFLPSASASFDFSNANTAYLFAKKSNWKYLYEINDEKYYLDTANSYKVYDTNTTTTCIAYILAVAKHSQVILATSKKVYYSYSANRNLYLSTLLDYRTLNSSGVIFSPLNTDLLNKTNILEGGDRIPVQMILSQLK